VLARETIFRRTAVDSFKNVVNSLLQLVLELGNLIVAGIVFIELWLRGELTQFGLPQTAQTIILLLLAVVLIVGALRLFGGLIRVAVVLILILIGIHILMPLLQH
jgi:hypothetical protein